MVHTLSTNSVTKTYSGRKVVNEVSINVSSGEIVGLLGPNGAGKTTTFYMCVGITSPDSGTVKLDDLEINHEPMYQRARLGIGYLPQEPSVFRKLTVEENIMAIIETLEVEPPEGREERLESLLAELGLTPHRKTMASALSGGERRRVEITRALVRSPRFILLDEPFAGIDPIAIKDIQIIVQALKSRNIGVLITDHNVQETLAITDKTYLMFEGGILKAGVPEELVEDEMVRRVYLGQNFELRKKKLEF